MGVDTGRVIDIKHGRKLYLGVDTGRVIDIKHGRKLYLGVDTGRVIDITVTNLEKLQTYKHLFIFLNIFITLVLIHINFDSFVLFFLFI